MEVAGSPADRDALVAATERNLWSLWRNFALAPGGRFGEFAGGLLLETAMPSPPYNMVMHFSGSGDVEARIDEIFGRYRARDTPFLWLTTPTSTPADLPDRLQSRGWAEVEPIVGMAASLDALDYSHRTVPPDIAIREIEPQDEGAIHHFVSWRWDVPPGARETAFAIYREFQVGRPGSPVRAWAAWRDGEPVAKAVLHCGGGAAGLHGVVTRSEARGQGLARTLTVMALTAARELGHEIAVLHSSTMAVGLYRSVGFEPVGDFGLYGPPGSFHI